jgi:hypothetical protein
VDQIYYRPGDQVYTINQSLGNNESFNETKIIHIPSGTSYTDPYWLRETGKTGYYTIEDINLRGLPELESQLGFHISLEVLGENLKIELPIIHKVTDPVKAEIYRPFEVTPPVFANISNSVIVFAGQAEQKVEVIVKAGKKDVAGNLSLEAGAGWSISPDFIPFTIQNKGDEQRFEFKVSPPEFQDISNLSAFISCEGKVYDKELIQIDYDHIPAQIVLRKSSSKIVNIDLKKEGESIGYIEGAGDQIPESLRQIGYNVDIVDPQDIDQQRLKKYDAVILGIRAFNTKDQLKHKTDELFKYVEEGGNLIVQYNTSRGLVLDELAPYPLKLSRDRVTDEYSEVRFLKPDHPALNTPNRITEKDFEGWVQERGLYFPNEWGSQFEAILSCNDAGETPKEGGLLIAKHGKGHYVYTGYSWFRELPAGVPGAYRIFTNLISLGQKSRS